jgi:hypothetical protein
VENVNFGCRHNADLMVIGKSGVYRSEKQEQ